MNIKNKKLLIWRMLREGAGLSQQEVADRLSVDRMVISRIENGQQDFTYEMAVQIIAVCGGKGFIKQVINELLSWQNWLSTDHSLFA